MWHGSLSTSRRADQCKEVSMYKDAFQLLQILKEAKKPVQCDEITKRLSISGSTVWKYINELRAIGYHILSSDEAGYELHDEEMTLPPDVIYHHLKTRVIGRQMRYFHQIPSTIWLGKTIAEQGGVSDLHGMVIIAEEQTGGVGRMGRVWVSPQGGIWVTIILTPTIPLDHLFMLTIAGSVAVAKVLRKILDIGAVIKWPNDIMIGDKKVAGLLLELGAEDEKVNYCLLGIGIDANVSLEGFHEDIKDNITTLSEEVDHDVDRAVILAAILKEFETRYDLMESGEYDAILREWKSLSSTIGRRVRVDTLRKTYEGVAIDLDRNGGLIIRKDNGNVEKIIAGDLVHIN